MHVQCVRLAGVIAGDSFNSSGSSGIAVVSRCDSVPGHEIACKVVCSVLGVPVTVRTDNVHRVLRASPIKLIGLGL